MNELVASGIKPFVTLMHNDCPQALQDKYAGFLSRSILNDFRDNCEICFKTYGDRVKNWITMNEPLVTALFGHDLGMAAPGRCSHCRAGNSSTEPYIVSHTHLLAHATAVKLYREKFKKSIYPTVIYYCRLTKKEYFFAFTPRNGVNVQGYIHWSLADNWEWASGFVPRFRLYYTDYKDTLTRIPKASAKWYKDFLEDNQ